MITKIIKRDGREAPFNIEKIAKAVFKAAEAAGGHDYNTAMDIACEVANQLEKNCGIDCKPTVEQIQDTVEKVLVKRGHARTAKEYILYRAERTRVREMNSKLMKTYEDLTFKSAKDSDIKRENANIDADTAMGTMLKYGSEGAKQFYEMYVLDPDHAKAHIEGDIHIHDLDFLTLTTTCCQIDIIKLFKGGFSTGHGFLREPKDIQSYSALACIAIQSNQNDQHGGQSIPNFDYGMALGVKKTFKKAYTNKLMEGVEDYLDTEDEKQTIAQVLEEAQQKTGCGPRLEIGAKEFDAAVVESLCSHYEITEQKAARLVEVARHRAERKADRDTYQAMEGFVHNLNTMHSRAGAQTPFSSINYGTDTSPEGRMVIRNILLATDAGLGHGETCIFPIHVFKVKEGVNYNEGDPNYDLFKLSCKVSAKRLFPIQIFRVKDGVNFNPGEPNYDLFKYSMEVSARRLFPNYVFEDAPFNLQYYKPGHPETEVATMGCRTRVMGNVYDPSREISYGRGNLSFTSINLPRIAIEADHDEKRFYEKLDEMLDLVANQLLDRFEIQASKRVYNYPFLMGQGVWLDSDKLNPNDEVREVLKHGTLSIGFIGLAETLTALYGHHHGESDEMQQKGLEIIRYMRAYCDRKSEETKMNFSLLATPAEGLSGRFIRMDKKRFGVIPGVTDKDYYTNSFHIPVWYNISAFEKIQKEAPYHALTNAGHISYVELDGDTSNNVDAFESVVRCMHDAGIGYGSINHPVDRDPVCGYVGVIGDVCPRCGRRDGESISPERLAQLRKQYPDIPTFRGID